MTAGELPIGSSSPPLVLDADTMRTLGYATVDYVVDYLTRADDPPALRRLGRGELDGRLRTDPPEHASGWAQLLEQVDRDVVAFAARAPPRLPRVHRHLRDVPVGARRLHRQCARHRVERVGRRGRPVRA